MILNFSLNIEVPDSIGLSALPHIRQQISGVFRSYFPYLLLGLVFHSAFDTIQAENLEKDLYYEGRIDL